MLRSVLCATLVLCAAAPASAEIQVVDAVTGAAVTPVHDDATTFLRWSDDGAGLLVRRNGRVLRVGVSDGSVVAQPLPARAESIGPGGRSLVRTKAGLELRGPDGRPIATIALTYAPDISVAWSPGGGRVAIAVKLLYLSVGDPELLVIDTATGAVVVRRPLEYVSVTPQAFAPDGGALVVSTLGPVVRIEVPSGAESVLLRGNGRAAWGASQRVAVTLDNRIRIPGDPAGEVRPRADTLRPAQWDAGGALLSYGFGIATDRCSPAREGVAVVAPGHAPRVLVAASDREPRGATWSPTGQMLAVDRGPDASVDRRGRRYPWPRRIARSYHMPVAAGDAAVRSIVLRASRALRRGAGRQATLRQVRKDSLGVSKRFAEVDGELVRKALAHELDRWLHAAGLEPIESYDEITC